MAAPLWTMSEIIAATGALREGDGQAPISGVSIDTRSLQAGDLFVALSDVRDGHEFVGTAFSKGAAAALVKAGYEKQPGDDALLRVDNPLRAMEALGQAARARLGSLAKVIAVTGSAGKTGTKEALRACLTPFGKTHASEKSYNNHFGVPLTLARMPADTHFGVFEIGMNHADEIRPLVKMVRPHAAIVTTVEAVHLENFASIEGIADAKAEIFEGLLPGGAAIVKKINAFADRLAAHATRFGARVVTFGLTNEADVSAAIQHASDAGTIMAVDLSGKALQMTIATPGVHIAENALAILAAIDAIGADAKAAAATFADITPPAGRGARTVLKRQGGEALLIDESYNANPASMRAALGILASVPRDKFARRIAVLGDMLELGPTAADMHTALHDAVDDADIDLLFACGPLMKGLYDAARRPQKAGYATAVGDIAAQIMDTVRAGDVVMIKASNGTKLGRLVEALKTKG